MSDRTSAAARVLVSEPARRRYIFRGLTREYPTLKNSPQQWLKVADILARKAKTDTDPAKREKSLRHSRNARRLAKAAADEGIDALLTPKGKLGSGPTFDEETYRKALPLLGRPS